jgi:hypothetical protein
MVIDTITTILPKSTQNHLKPNSVLVSKSNQSMPNLLVNCTCAFKTKSKPKPNLRCSI